MKGILVVTPVFPPVPGALSRTIESFCEELSKTGRAVTVATWDVAGRPREWCPGVHIVALQREGETSGVPSWAAVVRRLVASDLFTACVLFADPRDPLSFSLLHADLPPSMNFVVRLLVDRADAAAALNNAVIKERLGGILRRASAVVTATQNGPDRTFADERRVPWTFIPHACGPEDPSGDFRAIHGIPADSFTVLLPGEVCLVKHQLGLIQALRHALPATTLLFASESPPGGGEPPVEQRFAQEIAGRTDCRYLPGLDAGAFAAAFAASDVVAFASPWEHVPYELPRAMALGKPWIAAQECAMAREYAGGIRVPLTMFRETLAVLRERGDLRARLGDAGRRHWESCLSWNAVIPAWTDLIAHGTAGRAFDVPAALAQKQKELECELNAAVGVARHTFLNAFHEKPAGISFCIITDGGEPEKLRREIESIRAQGVTEHEILLGGAIPPGFDDVVCLDLTEAARNGLLGYMRNRLVEKTRFNVIVVADDDMLFHAGFARGILSYPEEYDVLCVKILNTDGTRFWDWAVYGSPSGHHLIPYETQDPFVYVTGGMCVMRSHVPHLVTWSDSLGFYQFEDIDYSRRLNAAGMRIRCCAESVVTHDDERYYGNNYQVAKRLAPPAA